MHSKDAGLNVTTGPIQPPPTTWEPPRGETKEGRKKMERRKEKVKREKKVRNWSAGGVPTWARGGV
jgi:hypothetical protein